MADTDDEIDALIDAAEAVLGLKIEDARRAGVAMNLRNLRALYQTVEGFDEPEACEPLGVYRP